MAHETSKASLGLPQALASRLEYLGKLLKALPASLPLDPHENESTYFFSLDGDEIEAEGIVFALTQNLKRCFRTHDLAPGESLRFRERGKRCEALLVLLKTSLRKIASPDDRDFIMEAWVERLIKAAKDSGAKVPSKRKQTAIDSETSGEDISMSNLNPKNSHHGGSRSLAEGRHLRNSTLDKFIAGWKALRPEERKAQEAKRSQGWRERREELEKVEKAAEEKKLAKKREDGLKRVKRFRERKRQQKALEGSHAVSKHPARQAKDQLLGSHPPIGAMEIHDVAALSRPDTKWASHRVGSKGGVVLKGRERTNYFHPFLWCHIDRVARQCNFSAAFTAKILSRDMPELFSRLSKGTVHGWLSKHGRRWSTRTLLNVERRRALSGKGRVGFLAKYPEIVEEVKTQLIGLRKTGISVNRVLGRAIFLAVIEEHNPHILDTFKCSEWFVGQFYSSVLRWSVRKGTRAAAHIPANANELCERTFFRMVHLAMVYDIPPYLWINLDQQGVYILPHNQVTYHDTNAKQVDTHGKEEKRAYTLCVASSAAGDFLPFQQVWSGKTAASVPRQTAEGMTEAITLGFHFAFAQSTKRTSHFSTVKTMKEWMVNILKPYIKEKIEVNNLPPDQRAILLLDCYPVHIGIEFRTYVDTPENGLDVPEHLFNQGAMFRTPFRVSEAVSEGVPTAVQAVRGLGRGSDLFIRFFDGFPFPHLNALPGLSASVDGPSITCTASLRINIDVVSCDPIKITGVRFRKLRTPPSADATAPGLSPSPVSMIHRLGCVIYSPGT